MMDRRKQLLIVNYDFPPAGGAGIKRGLKFMKFLPSYGWDCTVLTVKNGHHSIVDPSLLQEVAREVRVHRTFTFESLFHHPIVSGSLAQKPVSRKRSVKDVLRIPYDWLGQFVKLPDSRVLWLPAAILTGFRLLRREQFDVIFATGPTFVNFILAAILKKLSHKPLVLDFRDAWMGDPMLYQSGKKYLLKLHSLLEKFVIVNADCVTSTNPFVTVDFQRRYPQKPPSTFVTIYNGYDSEDFASLKEHRVSSERRDKFRIVFTGRLYGERTPRYFLEALGMALRKWPDMRKRVEVIFVGSCEEFLDGKRVEDYLDEFDLRDVVTLTGHVSRDTSLEYQLGATLLLLIIGIVPKEQELTYGLSGKVFDYILSNRPILTIADGGATREFVVENRVGPIYYHQDLEGIRDYLLAAYRKWEQGKMDAPCDARAYEKFDFRALTRTLAEQLDAVVKR